MSDPVSLQRTQQTLIRLLTERDSALEQLDEADLELKRATRAMAYAKRDLAIARRKVSEYLGTGP